MESVTSSPIRYRKAQREKRREQGGDTPGGHGEESLGVKGNCYRRCEPELRPPGMYEVRAAAYDPLAVVSDPSAESEKAAEIRVARRSWDGSRFT
ncbi:hypothetical protein GCM10017674_73040 [Streptomyces gardneri]|uniref:Uncharacterized protein n=1 Tax=Streptomyces gardneri TaxID=66892 RepID=A0A4Y3RWF5_9ACTN|nr:hypothetical protein SGA01_74770 [Streptomyces gardneri]GHH19773.1 hypothetical protein GCM10017674_73040 [Streptomyces gardneri]